MKQYHDMNGHMGVQKTFDSIRQKYYWPNLFKELNDFVTQTISSFCYFRQTLETKCRKFNLFKEAQYHWLNLT